MKKATIHLCDVGRILFGQAPPEFLLEVFIRTLIIYIAAMIVIRWKGKYMNGQLSIIEMSVMIGNSTTSPFAFTEARASYRQWIAASRTCR